ncbi:MAG TPA: SPOR domain-containing protein [Gemmatimonadaceae bacterium]|nr:SPOR domain-containing protein [Gemmatimonadaceae bacterium]
MNRWREDGHAIAATLDSHSAAVIIGRQAEDAAEVALGIAESQARRRRVAVGDLVGEVAPLQSLVPVEIVHGLMDAFLHGVSLNRIAHPIDRAGNLFIMQSGPGPIDYPALLRDDRWRRLASGFRETGALLLAVVPEGAPGVDALAHALGAIVRVDGARVPGVAPVIASAGESPEEIPQPPDPEPQQQRRVTTRRSTPDAVDVLRMRSGVVPRVQERAGIGLWIAIAAGLTLGIGAVVGWFNRDHLGFFGAASTPLTAPTEPVASEPLALGAVVNPDDSAAAAAYVVVIANVTDSGTARRRLTESLSNMPATTFSPDTPWYRVSVGAFPSESAAGTVLQGLRANRTLDPESGYLLRAPFSLRLTMLADSAAARDSLAAWQARGVPAFALLVSESSVAVYAGAYETREQAAAALAAHRPIAPAAVVAYRVGRVF